MASGWRVRQVRQVELESRIDKSGKSDREVGKLSVSIEWNLASTYYVMESLLESVRVLLEYYINHPAPCGDCYGE